MITRVTLLALMLLSLHGQAHAILKVGNGGDLMDSLLLTLRNTMVRTLAAAPAPELCDESELNDAQQKICRQFLEVYVAQVMPLLVPEPVPPFLLTSTTLVQERSNGHERTVMAATECAPDAPIVFHLDSLRPLSPPQIFQLMAHEFGHKVAFAGGSCLRDDDTVPGFSGPDGGRQLLDAVARTLRQHAQRARLLGESYVVFDRFRCEISEAERPFPMSSTVSVQRTFPLPGNQDTYSVIMGEQLTQPECSIAISAREQLVVQLAVEEQNGCSGTEGRATRISLVKVSEGAQAELLAERMVPGWNPMCRDHQVSTEISATVGNGTRMKFRLEYLGTLPPLLVPGGLRR